MEDFDSIIIRNFAIEEVQGLRKKFKKALLFSRIGYWSNWIAGLFASIIIIVTAIGFIPLTGYIAMNILCLLTNLLFVHIMNEQVEEQKECIMVCDEILGKL